MVSKRERLKRGSGRRDFWSAFQAFKGRFPAQARNQDDGGLDGARDEDPGRDVTSL